MRTAEQWLKEKDLPTELGRVLVPEEEWKHDVKPITSQHVKCKKCRKMICVKGRKWDLPNNQPCSVPNRITIDQNTAKYWQGKCDPDVFCPMLFKVWKCTPLAKAQLAQAMHFWAWRDAQPKHYLIAAAMATERKEE